MVLKSKVGLILVVVVKLWIYVYFSFFLLDEKLYIVVISFLGLKVSVDWIIVVFFFWGWVYVYFSFLLNMWVDFMNWNLVVYMMIVIRYFVKNII